jgi:hypothetical protein
MRITITAAQRDTVYPEVLARLSGIDEVGGPSLAKTSRPPIGLPGNPRTTCG